MHINVTVNLDHPDETFAYTPDDAAAQVIAALGGDQTKDYCMVTINTNATGQAGSFPDVPPPASP